MEKSQKTLYDKVVGITKDIHSLGIENVYFEPPQSIKMNYPCWVFKRGTMSTRHAGNRTYKIDDSFDGTFIRLESDDDRVHDILNKFVMIRHVRPFVADGLHHDQFKLYY